MHWLYLFGEPDELIPEADGSLGTDIGALRAGHVSLAPLSFAVELGDLPRGFSPSSADARAYLAMLEQFDLSDVTVIGNSFGGGLPPRLPCRRAPGSAAR